MPLLRGNSLRFLVAQPTQVDFLQKNEPLPNEVRVLARPHQGVSVRVRGNRQRDVFDRVIANWPDDRLTATRAPMLICTVAGQSDVRMGDYILRLPEGTFCLLPPETPRTDGSESHILEDRGKARSDLLWLRGDEHALETWVCHSLGKEHRIGDVTRRVAIHSREAMMYFSTLLRESQSYSAAADVICKGILQVLMGLVLRDLREGNAVTVSARARQPVHYGPDWNPIQHACDYMRTNLHQHLTIEYMARLSCMASTRFTRRFKNETGRTFNEYLTALRLERAQMLLRDTEWTAQFVAADIGLQPAQLRRLFMRHLKTSPSAFRHRARAELSGTQNCS
jgi:AraC-like DNA-binding protein